MAGIVWSSGANITCSSSAPWYTATLNGNATASGMGRPTTAWYRFWVNDSYNTNFSANKYANIQYGLYGYYENVKIQVEAQIFDLSTGTEYTSLGPTIIYTPTAMIAWNSGAYVTATELSDTQIGLVLHGTASLINGGQGTVVYKNFSGTPPTWTITVPEDRMDTEITVQIYAYANYSSWGGDYDRTREALTCKFTLYSGNLVKCYTGQQGGWKFCEVYYYVGDGSGNYGTNNNWQQCTPKIYQNGAFRKISYA